MKYEDISCPDRNSHTKEDLKQMQALPLDEKIIMTKARIKAWYEGWTKYKIYNAKTEKVRYITHKTLVATEDERAELKLKDDECVVGEENGQVYVSFSGGKDSTVLLHIARQLYPNIEAVFIDTGLEYPEIREFVKTKDNVTWLKPEMSFRKVLEKYGYPVISKDVSQKIYQARRNPSGYAWCRFNNDSEYVKKYGLKYSLEKYNFLLNSKFPISDLCCNELKKKPAKKYEKNKKAKPLLATMAQESLLRQRAWEKNGCNVFNSMRPTSSPMAFWTEQDVLNYIKIYNIPYASVYGDIVIDKKGKLCTTGCNRTGCIFCGFGAHLEKEPNHFQRLKETHPKLWDYCMREWDKGGLGMKEVLDFIGVKTELDQKQLSLQIENEKENKK